MNRLRRLIDSNLPALIHLHPMVAMAYYQAVAMDDGPHGEAVTAAGRGRDFHVTVVRLADVPPSGSVRIVTSASR